MPDDFASDTRAHLARKTRAPQHAPNLFVRFLRAVFGYRKTSLTVLVLATWVATVVVSGYDRSLLATVSLPEDALELRVLNELWMDLQKIARYEHTYNSWGNDYVHDLLELRIATHANKSYIEYDNDLNNTLTVMYGTNYLSYHSIDYYESNNLVVRINGLDPLLPALLLSAHYDSVPSSYGVTDDGFGVAALLGVLNYYADKKVRQPKRTIVLNFNNNEEFGLYGATAFLSHPWAKNIRYFLNLEGTGAGGKAILFRGTDHGIVNHFKAVRYPFATSWFQQAFNNHLILSETDYKVYYQKAGLRGLDVAFYKPRDLYHTAGDNIKNVDIRSLWHMLSNALDFTADIVAGRVDLDDERFDSDDKTYRTDLSVFTSVFNTFFAFPVSKVVVLNIVLLVVIPLVALLFFVVIFYRKKRWDVNFINVVKFPVSLGVSVSLLNIITDSVVIQLNRFLPNANFALLVTTLFALFLLLNYLILNGINAVFHSYKGMHHDEKLIVLIEICFLYWVTLIWSTAKLAHTRPGEDHTGELPIVLLFILQATGVLVGLLGWLLTRSEPSFCLDDADESRPLLVPQDNGSNYESSDREAFSGDSEHHRGLSLSSLSLNSSFSDASVEVFKFFSYDWSLQFLIIVPLSSFIIYNSGFLILDGLNKTIQESLDGEVLVYRFIQLVAVIWALPFLPFIFKLNRIMVLILVAIIIQGFFFITIKSPFDQENPLKLRFIQKIDLNTNPAHSYVEVHGREISLVEEILNDIPSVKETRKPVDVAYIGDGNLIYSYDTSLTPNLVSGVDSLEKYLDVQILKNSSSNIDHPFGLLTGEIKVKVPKNRNLKLFFNLSDSVAQFDYYALKADPPVKTVIVYADKKDTVNGTSKLVLEDKADISAVPEGFSRDKDGNYIYKDLKGITEFQLNKLDWDKTYHIGFQWVPSFIELKDIEADSINVQKMGVVILAYWAELGSVSTDGEVKERIPAFDELLHYSPNYVSWANRERGLVSISKTIEV